MRKLFIHRVSFLISTYLPIWNRFGTGNILAMVFGILLAFSLIATGYLFFSRRRGRPSKRTETVAPFQNVEYNYLQPPKSQGLQEPTPHTSMQSSNFAMPASKTSNEVSYLNVSH
jgi:hypothetical protein